MMAEPTVTCRGADYPWHFDHTGRMNVILDRGRAMIVECDPGIQGQ